MGDIRYQWRLLRAGELRLDGGSMFGVVPRVVWSRAMGTDDRGRVVLGHNCLLLTRVGDGTRVLVESGSGGKLTPKMKDVFGLTDRTVETALREAGVRPEDVRHAIVSHLHFDHCGGLTRTGSSPLVFPNAEVITQRQEWDDALVNRSTMTRTYLPENLDPLRDRVRLVDSPPPFARGYRPDKTERPLVPLDERATEVVPGIDVFLVPGHTLGMQAVRFTDDAGRTVVFAADLVPTVHHVGAAYNMAYDQEPYTSTVTRGWFLAEAVRNDWTLVLDHEPDHPVCRVSEDGHGWYKLERHAPEASQGGPR